MAPLSLTGNYQVVAALLFGMALGFLLVKSDLAWRESWRGFFQLQSGRMLKTLILAVVAGTALFFLARRAGMARVHVPEAWFWTSLLGGAVSGVGAALVGLVPVAALASLAGGRLYALGAFAGMLLAVPVMYYTKLGLRVFAGRWAVKLPEPVTPESFFSIANPALWICLAGAVILVVVHYSVGERE